MGEDKEKFGNVKCLVAVQPISISVFVSCFLKDKYPSFIGMIPDIEKEGIKKGGYSFAEMTPIHYVKDICAPVLFVQALTDKWTDVRFVQELYDKAPEPKELLLLQGEMHRFDTYNYFGHKPEQLLAFIKKYL